MSDDELLEKVAAAMRRVHANFGPRHPDDRFCDCSACTDGIPPNDLATYALAAVDLPAVRAEAERAGAARALREAAGDLDPNFAPWTARWLRSRAAEVELGVTAQATS